MKPLTLAAAAVVLAVTGCGPLAAQVTASSNTEASATAPPTPDRTEQSAASQEVTPGRSADVSGARPRVGVDTSGLTRDCYGPPPPFDTGSLHSPSRPLGRFNREC